MKGMKKMSSKNIFSWQSRTLLVALFLLLLGGWNTQAWGESYSVTLTNTSTTTWTKSGEIRLTFSDVEKNSNGYKLTKVLGLTAASTSTKDMRQGQVKWENQKTGYSIKVTKAKATFKHEASSYTYRGQGRIYQGSTDKYTGDMYGSTNNPCPIEITNSSGFGDTFIFTSGRTLLGHLAYLQDFTITYSFTPNNYTVKFNNQSATSAGTKSVSVTFDATTNLTSSITCPTKTGYTFGGYYTGTNGSGSQLVDANGAWVKDVTDYTGASGSNATWVKAGDVTLYAKWTANTYEVAFNGNGSTGSSMTNQTFTYDAAEKALTKNAFERAYTVTYDADGGTTVATTAANTTATYTFKEWNTKADGSGTTYADEASVQNLATSGTFNLYAQWNSGSVTLPNATKTNAVIEGWYDGSTKVGVPGDAYTPTTNTTLTAKWIAQYPFTMSGSDRTMDVGDEISPAFTFTYAENPTAHITAQFSSSVNSGDTVVEYDAVNNKLIARNAGKATIYFTQANTATILPGTSETWTITVNKITNTLERTVATYEMYVDDELEGIINSSVAVKNRNNNDVAVTVTTSDEDLIRYVSGEDKIIVPNTANEMFGASKVVNVIFSQPETYKYTAASETIAVTVKKYITSFSGSAYNDLMVDDTQTADYSYTNTSATQPTASSSDDFYYTIDDVNFTNEALNNDSNLVTFNPSNKLITACNAGTAKITLHQKETYKYTGATASFDVKVAKYANTITCSWGSWTKTLNFEEGTLVTFSSNNNLTSLTPIVVTQTSGEQNATYYPDQKAIYASYKIGSATWSVAQAENYKYQAAETKTVTVNVDKTTSTCSYFSQSAQHELDAGDEWEVTTWSGNYANEISFQAAKNMATAYGDLNIYILLEGGTWQTLNSIGVSSLNGSFGSYDFGSTYFTYNLSANVRGIKFKNTGDYKRAIRNLTLKRKTYLTLSESSLTMPVNTLGGNHTTATFEVDYSTCAGQIKVVSNHPHLTVSEAAFSTGTNQTGTKTITITYAADETEAIDGVITVYTPYENKTLAVHAETEKQTQTLTWGSLYAGETISLPQTFSADDAATASSNLPVSYQSGNSSIIEIAADGLSFTVVGTGQTTLTATQAGNDTWKAVSETKTVNATNKLIQNIVWNQNFTRSLSVGNEIPLTAKVKVYNLAAGTETEDLTRSALVTYSCPDENGVISVMDDGKTIRITGTGETTLTASVAGDESYEAAVSVTKTVRVRAVSTGDCEAPLVLEKDDEIEFFQMNTNQITGSSIAIDHNNGEPDKLSYDVRGEYWKLGVEYYTGGIYVQQSTDNGLNWTTLNAAVSPSKGTTLNSGDIQLSRNATHIRFVRPKGGEGYHYVGNIQITALPFIETENTTIELGNIPVGAIREITIPISYSNVKGNMNVTKLNDNGLTVDNIIEANCGDIDTYDLPVSISPVSVGPWDNQITILDTKRSMSLTVTLSATATKGSQAISWAPMTSLKANDVVALNAEATSGLTVTYAVTSGTDVASIVDGAVVIAKPGTFTITASQAGNADYNAAESVLKTFIVAAETLTLTAPTAADLTYGQTLSESVLTGGSAVDSKGNTIEGSFAWQSGATVLGAGEGQYQNVVFTPAANQAWYNTAVIAVPVNVAITTSVNEFVNTAGDNDWENPANWSSGSVPEGENPAVIISAPIIIDEDITVGSLTIANTASVDVVANGKLTVTGITEDRDDYGDLIIANGGEVNVEGSLKVHDLVINSKSCTDGSSISGQLSGEDNITNINGDVYIDITLVEGVLDDSQWYGFTVPFEVDGDHGVYRYEAGNVVGPLTWGNQYYIANYDSEKRYNTGKGWQYYHGTLNAGEFYYITLNGSQNVYRFKKKAGSAIYSGNTKSLSLYGADSASKDANWNAVGNPTLTYTTTSYSGYVQIYQNGLSAYKAVAASEATFVVGCPFFIQAAEAGTLVLDEGNGTKCYAPARSEEKAFNISLQAETGGYADNVFLTTSEEADGSYRIGHDLLKAGTTKLAPQLWIEQDDNKLCVNEAEISANNAFVVLGLYAPTTGNYVLDIVDAPEDATLYLTCDGLVVWNLSESAYTLSLMKGTTSNYGLQLVQEARTMPTDMESVNHDTHTQKFIHNGVLYIHKDGVLYNALGEKVK